MKKQMLDLQLVSNEMVSANYCLMKLTHALPLPEMLPGQFVEVKVEGSNTTFLRRPISIHYVDRAKNELWILVQLIGDGSKTLAKVAVGSTVNVVLPLGNTFTVPDQNSAKVLLVGGGVGTAPMLYLGACLKEAGFTPVFLLGARSAADLVQLELFKTLGEVYTTTEDGSMGEKGYVIHHSILAQRTFDQIYTCGPKGMMFAVARFAKENGINCEVSLENTMACGVGACLCCVEKTQKGNVCVCTEGPVFNINQLSWPI